MKSLLSLTTTLVVFVGLAIPIHAQDPFDGGISIPLDYGQLIATMGEQNDSLQGWIFDWLPAEDSIIRLSAEAFPDGYQCGDDRDFASADFNHDGMDEIVMAWNRSDGGIFVAIPTYNLVNMTPNQWNTPESPIAGSVLYATDTLAEVLGEIRVAAGNFYADSAMEFVLAYLAADSTVSITVFDVDTSSLTPEARGSISDQAIHTAMPEVQRFGTASRFDVATGDLNGDGTDEIVLIASDPEQTPESDLMVNVYDYDASGHTISLVSQNPWMANMRASEVSCLRRIAATAGDFDADASDEVAFTDDWARTDEDTLHYACTHILDFSSDMLSIADSWDRDSTGFAHLQPFSGVSWRVHALTMYNGDLIAGGEFDSAGGVHVNRIARWDGTQWRALATGLNNTVHALAVYDGDLIAGGDFIFADPDGENINARRIARWDGSQWHAMVGGYEQNGFNSAVYALAVYDNNLYAGGDFVSAYWNGNLVNARRIARWDGSQWYSVVGGSQQNGFDNSVYALMVYDNNLYAGGNFVYAYSNGNQVTARRIARWDGTSWDRLSGGVNETVRALTVYGDDLLVGGDFVYADIYTPDTVTARRIALWDGTNWDRLAGGVNGTVRALTVYGDDLLVGGDFVYADIETPDTVTARRIALWDGSSWDRLVGGVSSTVRALTDYGDDLVVAGDFIYANIHTPDTVRARRIGRWDGSQWDSLQSRSDFIVDILADDVDFAPDSADEIIVRGYSDPSPWLGWNPAISFWIYGVGEDFTGCTRSGNCKRGLWGIDGVNGSRRTMAVGDFVDDDNNYKDLVLLRSDPNLVAANNILVFVIDTSVLAPCSSPAGPDLDSIAGWTDTSGIITDLITANLDTATIELRAPSYYNVDSIIQPLVILNVPPIHYDILDDTTWDVSNRYPWPPDENYETYCAYGNRQDWVTSVQSEVRKDWGISAGLKTHFSSCGATVKAHLNTEYGEGFSVQGGHSTTLSVIQVMEAHAEDMVLAASIDYDIWEYPVYRRGERLVGGDVVVVDPSEVRKVWYTGKEIESWITDHEVENIFSYARYPDLADNPMVASEGVIEGYTWPMAPSSRGYFALRKEEFESSTVEESNNFGVEVGASIGYEGGLSFFGLGAKWGFEVSVEGNYSRSELNTYTTTFTTADSLHVQYGYINSSGSFEGNRKYEITPYAYWAKNGSLVLDYAAGPIVNPGGEDPTWWQNHYSDPDPAFVLPWRLDPEKEGTEPGENRYKTREIVFIPSQPTPGDTVLILARVHNFSLNPTLDPVRVSFYLGDPDNFGQLLYDKNTGDSIFPACDFDGFPTVIESQGEVAAQMVWQVPDEGSITECQRIWALIDPLDEITDEVHDNAAEITNNKGWNRLDVNTTTECLDRDGDGWEESAFRCCDALSQWDNCPDVYNPDQTDSNGDGIGDACQWMCGDADGSLGINILDVTYIINYLYKNGPAPEPEESADADGSGTVNILDVTHIINYLYKNGPDPIC